MCVTGSASCGAVTVLSERALKEVTLCMLQVLFPVDLWLCTVSERAERSNFMYVTGSVSCGSVAVYCQREH